MEALKNSGHEGRVDIGLDVAASEFYDAKKKHIISAKKQEPMIESILKIKLFNCTQT